MGWLLNICLLDGVSSVTILKFINIGITHPQEGISRGLFVGIFNWNLMLVIAKSSPMQIDEKGGYA